MLEERGLPTTVIALVLPQVEKTRPPRAVMTPFVLGRPFAEPNDPAFQTRVLLQALRLLERTEGPVILDHFPDDNPSAQDRADWAPSVTIPPPVSPTTVAGWETAFREELALVLAGWERFRHRFGRTSVGLSGQDQSDWPACAAAFLSGALPTVPPHATPALTLRFLVDDIKALYAEAAQADGPPPSARQIDLWFWRQTVAGQLLIAQRTASQTSKNNALKTVGGRFFVPVPYLPV